MGFTKLDEGIVFSSIMGEDDSVFRIFVIFLATCKEDGVSHISEIFISTITKKPIEEVCRCIKILESPDQFSRTKEYEGRRIERIDGGFKILNYDKYRARTDTEYLREKQRKYREKRNGIYTVSIPSASASVSSSSSVPNSKRINQEIDYSESFNLFWTAYPRKTGKGGAWRAWRAIESETQTLPLILTALEWQRESDQWTRDNGQYIPLPATYLNQRRWEDEQQTTTTKRLRTIEEIAEAEGVKL